VTKTISPDCGLQSARIVIVDDEEMILQSLSAFLELEGCRQVHCYRTGAEALEHFEHEGCDVLVTDYGLPDMDGVELLARARQMDPGVPRIMLTAHADLEQARRAIRGGALFHFLQKPWSNDALRDTLLAAMRRRRELRGAAQVECDRRMPCRALRDLCDRLLGTDLDRDT
jgi:two-component system C4-dicarboxylate transport response regulator DctD